MGTEDELFGRNHQHDFEFKQAQLMGLSKLREMVNKEA